MHLNTDEIRLLVLVLDLLQKLPQEVQDEAKQELDEAWKLTKQLRGSIMTTLEDEVQRLTDEQITAIFDETWSANPSARCAVLSRGIAGLPMLYHFANAIESAALSAQSQAVGAGWTDVALSLPSHDPKPGSFGVKVLIRPTINEENWAFYGCRVMDKGSFYRYGAVLEGITEWRYPT